MIHYASTPEFLSTGVLTSQTCFYGHGGVLSETAREQVFWKGQKIGFSKFRSLGGQYKYGVVPPFGRKIIRSDNFKQSSDKPLIALIQRDCTC